eukprot:8180599-Alexandrium_andersonii.AAC.1
MCLCLEPAFRWGGRSWDSADFGWCVPGRQRTGSGESVAWWGEDCGQWLGSGLGSGKLGASVAHDFMWAALRGINLPE